MNRILEIINAEPKRTKKKLILTNNNGKKLMEVPPRKPPGTKRLVKNKDK